MFRSREEQELNLYYANRGGKSFQCEQDGCTRRFCSVKSARQHTSKMHSDPSATKPYACPEEGCASAYMDGSSLRRHQREVHSVGPLPRLTCPVINFPYEAL
jgi:hypothetical protein